LGIIREVLMQLWQDIESHTTQRLERQKCQWERARGQKRKEGEEAYGRRGNSGALESPKLGSEGSPNPHFPQA
jgi:hypothetical protein